MQLNLIIDDWSMDLEIPDGYIETMGDSFEKMDRDMDKGWQIGQKWTRNPNATQRCQLVAGKLLTALETNNEQLAMMMGGYIVSRMNGVKRIIIDNTGEPEETTFD
ncbi:MAG: hypothetical protein ABW139_11340 [Candidatus Thiodiazotropha sp. DIVDIV]